MLSEREAWYWLACQNGIGAVTAKKLLSVYESPLAIYQENPKVWEETSSLRAEAREALLSPRDEERIHRNYDALYRERIGFVTLEEEAYPRRLKNLYDPPVGLFYKGNLPNAAQPSLAIVGARNCSSYGRETAISFAKAAALAGVCIISGLARGVDGAAHKGALEADGVTFGVLGCGVDVCYPAQNLSLYEQMQDKGGVLSELPPGSAPLARNFPMRNRLISGLSDGILVVEARERSGSLITIDQGLEQGKDIFAIPGRITDPLSAGCNRVIGQGAVPVMSPADLLTKLGNGQQLSLPLETLKSENLSGDSAIDNGSLTIMDNRVDKFPLDSPLKKVYDCLSFVPKTIQELVTEANFPPNQVICQLEQLEETGFCREETRGCYVRARL